MLAGDDVSGRSSLIGVAISLSGNVLISLALNCQKLAHIRLQHGGEKERAGGGGHIEAEASGLEAEQDAPANGDLHASESEGLLQRLREQTGQRYGATSSSVAPTGQTGSPSSTSSGQKHNNLHETVQGKDAGTRPRGRSSNGGSVDLENGKHNANAGSQFKTDFLKSRLWWLGIGLMTLGEFGNFLSYGFAPASLVAPLGAVALLANVIFSPILLKERFRLSDLGGILLAIIGAVTVVFSSKQSDASLSPDELWEAIRRTEFIAYAAISAGLVALLAWASSTRLGDTYILLDVGVCALFGGFTVLSTKGLSSLVSQMGPFELLRFPISYGLIVILVGTALAQITYLNRALQRFDSREVIPSQFVMFTISAIVGSAILYQDFKDTEARQLINFLFGCATTFLGVFLLTKNGDDDVDGNENDYSDEEQDGVSSERLTSREDDDQVPEIESGVPKTPRQGVRIAQETIVPLSAQRRRTTGNVSVTGPSLAAIPVSVPAGRRAGGGFFGPSPRRTRYRSANSGASVPTVSLRHGSTQDLAGPSSVTETGGITAAIPGDTTPITSTSFQEARSMPVLYTRRSIFNPAFSITYIAPPFPRVVETSLPTHRALRPSAEITNDAGPSSSSRNEPRQRAPASGNDNIA